MFRLDQILEISRIAEGGAHLRINAERQPDVGCDEGADAAETFRAYPDDGERLAVYMDRAADKIRPPAHSFPEAMAHDNDGNVRVRPAFLGVVEAAERRLNTHEREKVLGGEKREAAPHPFVTANPGQSEIDGRR